VRGAFIAAGTVLFLALSGVGFACVEDGGCHGGGGGGGGCSSSPEISWVNPASTTVSGSGVVCHESFTSSALTLSVTGLTPGASCSLAATLENVGQEPVTLGAQISANMPSSCRLYTYADDLLGAARAPTVDPGKTYGYDAVVKLSGTATDPCEGTVLVLTVTITADGTNACYGFPQGLVYSPTQGG